MKRRAIVACFVAVFAAFCGHAEVRERRAVAFIDYFRPILEQYYSQHGEYPESLPVEWYPQEELPTLVRPDFYLVFDDGQGYLMRFVNPVSMPYDDVVAFQSDIGHWSSWDGY